LKKENTSIRLQKIMKDRQLRQIDILNLTLPFCKQYDVKMNKSDISQYVAGKNEPNQDKLAILGMALNINEGWLMGYDVPMERAEQQAVPIDATEIISCYNMLNLFVKKTATEQVRLLTLDEKYTKPDNVISIVKEPGPDYLAPNAAHERTDKEFTEEERLEDDSMLD